MNSYKPNTMKLKLFWGDNISGWRIYGLWINKKYFIGFSVTEPNTLSK